MSWKKEIDEIFKRRLLALGQGGESAVAKHHAKGKLTARERVLSLLDPATFKEFGSIAGTPEFSADGSLEKFTPANYIIGLGKIHDRTVAVGAEDFTLKGGSPNAAGLRKSMYAEHLAIDYKVPLVRLLEGGGGSVKKEGNDAPKTSGDPLFGSPRFTIIADAMGKIPVVSAALGPVAGFPAGRLVSSHFSVMTKETSQIMIAGPAVVKRALGIDITKEQLGGSQIHAHSGIIDNLACSEEDAFQQIKTFLSYLPNNVWEKAPRLHNDDPVDRCDQTLSNLVPTNRRRSYNIRKILESIVDRQSFFEISPSFGPGLTIALARLNGQPVGITANNCNYNAGAMTAQTAQKMRRLIELCEIFHLPIVNFVDEPGFMIGPDAEKAGTIRYGMAAVAAASQATVPWASVRIRKSYGVASAAHFGPNSYILDWPSVESGALPVEGGVAVAFHRKIAAAENPEALRNELENQLLDSQSPFSASESFSSHEIIDPAETRPHLCQWVDWVQPKLGKMLGETTFSVRP